MLKRTVIIFLFLLLRIFTGELFSQKAYFNTGDAVYELNSNVNVCQYTQLPITCESRGFFSIAMYKDTLYYTTFLGGIYRYVIDQPGSCQIVASSGFGNAMTADKNGLLYIAGGNKLSRYNPRTGQLADLGTMPCSSSGDLVFYKDKLLLAGTDGQTTTGLYEINIQTPSASKLFMSTPGNDFYGILSFPVSCGKSRFFGLSATDNQTRVIELDLENKKVLTTTCNISAPILDACSMTEIGYDDGQISNIDITPPCSAFKTGSIKVSALSMTPGIVTYQLDNGITNTSGEFANVRVGPHTVTTITADGCKDTKGFNVEPVSLIDVTAEIKGPDNCRIHNGTIQLSATAVNASPPFTYTLVGNSTTVPSGYFNNLAGGLHTFRVTSADNCVTDTAILLAEKSRTDCNDILIPNAFTPNQDGLNDLFKPYHSFFIKDMSMQIYNRWGQKMYSANGLGLYWDGTFNRVKQQPGAYVYVIRYTDYNNNSGILKGTVILVQ